MKTARVLVMLLIASCAPSSPVGSPCVVDVACVDGEIALGWPEGIAVSRCDDCADGFACVTRDAFDRGWCAPYCEATEDCDGTALGSTGAYAHCDDFRCITRCLDDMGCAGSTWCHGPQAPSPESALLTCAP